MRTRLRGTTQGSARWLASAAATAASTYALDAIATACGVAAVASGALDGLGTSVVVGLLGLSYVGWLAGLVPAMRANVALLDRTGLSTNVVSKAAYDLARRRSGSDRKTRIAAACGYVATEAAKEVPYLVGAFGAASLSDGLTGQDALVFLVGANLGAGLYEATLAVSTRLLLRRRHAAFETRWDPDAYLSGYYAAVEPDEQATIAWLVGELRRASATEHALVYGVGPTMHHVFAVADVADEIDLAEHLPANRAHVRRWLDAAPGAHDWRPFVRHTLRCEGLAEPTPIDIQRRDSLTRERVRDVVAVDLRNPVPDPERYDIVVSCYCADSATADAREWAGFVATIAEQVEPGGLLLMAALRRCRGYVVGGHRFPSAGIDEHDLRRVLEGAWGPGSTSVAAVELSDQPAHGYAGIVLASATRPLSDPSAGPSGASAGGGRLSPRAHREAAQA